MRRFVPILLVALSLLVAVPAFAGPKDDGIAKGELMTLENELYAEARVTRDFMAALHESGELGTPDGQARMGELTDHLAEVQQQIRAVREQRQVVLAAKRTERLRKASRAIALRDRGPKAAPTIRNARR